MYIAFIPNENVKWFYSYDFYEALIVRECMKLPLYLIPIAIKSIEMGYRILDKKYKRTYFKFNY